VLPSVAAAVPSAAVAAGSAALALDGALAVGAALLLVPGLAVPLSEVQPASARATAVRTPTVGPASLSVRMYVLPDEPASR
jgi:hypothetical protein